ncbi:hypothetical protein [Gimesia aquarii]|uniref:Uncharacterized protein n=1 Tax=Gimesia aquarii TaxID=2527964 RepID=A0A517VR27_9PLAN|nr:hypothetical protein [Gimesia aquarii]QDT95400.1 hypothetical protein V144x_08430 [Gimesia aquarii]
MKKKSSSKARKPANSSKRLDDRVATEFAEMKAKKIPAKNLVWMFRITTSKDEQIQPALRACIEFLQDKLGKRCRVVLETERVDRKKIHDLILKSSKLTFSLLSELDQGMAECSRKLKVKYTFLGFGEEVYQQTSWKTLGTVFEPLVEISGDFDCRNLRFDGLYCCDTGEVSSKYLRFYDDGQCVFVNAVGTVNEVATWLRRERKGLTVGTYQVQRSSLSALLEQQALRGEEPTIFKLKVRLTKQGLKVRFWSSYSNAEIQEIYGFHEVKLK